MDKADHPWLGEKLFSPEDTSPNTESHRETETPRIPGATGHRSRLSKAFNKLTDGSSRDSGTSVNIQSVFSGPLARALVCPHLTFASLINFSSRKRFLFHKWHQARRLDDPQ